MVNEIFPISREIVLVISVFTIKCVLKLPKFCLRKIPSGSPGE